MTNPMFALRQAMLARLSTDAILLGLLGGARINEETQRPPAPPCVTFGEASVRDASASAMRADEHQAVLTVWTDSGGAKQAFAIADQIVASLETMGPTLDGHRVANLVALATEVRREKDGRLTRAVIRVRAFTEPL